MFQPGNVEIQQVFCEAMFNPLNPSKGMAADAFVDFTVIGIRIQ